MEFKLDDKKDANETKRMKMERKEKWIAIKMKKSEELKKKKSRWFRMSSPQCVCVQVLE